MCRRIIIALAAAATLGAAALAPNVASAGSSIYNSQYYVPHTSSYTYNSTCYPCMPHRPSAPRPPGR